MKAKFMVEMSLEEFNEYQEWIKTVNTSEAIFTKHYSSHGMTFAGFKLLSKDEALTNMAEEIGRLKESNQSNFSEIYRLQRILDEKKIKY